MSEDLLVAVVDDDASVRESLRSLLRALGFRASTFASAREFLASPAVESAGCLLLDVQMQEMSGPQLQRHLSDSGSTLPVVFITSNDDPRLRTTLVEAGAIDCLLKPFHEHALIAALAAALGPRTTT